MKEGGREGRKEGGSERGRKGGREGGRESLIYMSCECEKRPSSRSIEGYHD